MKCRGSVLSRRGFLTVGAVGGLGLTLADFLSIRQAQAAVPGNQGVPAKAKSVIHIFLDGGMAHQESFDPKPFSPLEYRGDMKTVRTNTGEVFCETLPNLAKIADKFTVLRAVSHGEAAHERGTHNMFTGYRPSPAIQYPSMGSVVSHEYGPRNNLPAYVCIPNVPNEHAGSGYLSASYAPFALGADPARDNFRVRDLNLPGGVDEERFARRRSALEMVNHNFRNRQNSDAVVAMDSFYERAYSMLSSPEAREAFDLDQEPDNVRDEYGRHEPGQRMLMARRLVAAGARFVTLNYGGWDMHQRITPGVQRRMPPLDQGLAALLNDLDRRGMLDETLVLLSTEFGRTPRINQDAGRDHWPRCFSVMLAGGGIQRGMIHGETNATASEPDRDLVSPEDLAYTIYNRLGIVADKELMAPGGRPIEIVDGGKLIEPIVV